MIITTKSMPSIEPLPFPKLMIHLQYGDIALVRKIGPVDNPECVIITLTNKNGCYNYPEHRIKFGQIYNYYKDWNGTLTLANDKSEECK